MKTGNSHLNWNNTPRLWSDLILGYAYAFFLAFLFVAAQAPALANSIIDGEEIAADNHKSSHFDFLISDYNAAHHPFVPAQAPLEPKGADENESIDSSDDEVSKITSNLDLAARLNLGSQKCQFSQHLLSIGSRPRISLIILHHSWKSFLS